MRYISKLLLMSGIATISLLLLATTVQAADDAPLSDAHKQRIVSNCTSAKSSLERLHRSDASLRVNRGQLYEHTSTKLMARLNSRLALNRLDGAELVAAAAQYERTLGDFREAYRLYEEQLTSAIRTDCVKQPEVFYYRVLDARTKRETVYKLTIEINKYSNEYYQAFGRFSDDYRAAVKGVTR